MSLFRQVSRLAFAVGLLACTPALHGEEYFLDGAQRRELLMQGRITGRDSASYDVWIVPGYAPPSRHIGEGWHAAGHDLADYGDPGYLHGMVDTTRRVMRYARKDILAEFALQGTRGAWREATDTASRRVQRRVFGWWFAWPWALIEASAESAVRVGGGVPGAAIVWGGGAVATPAAYLMWPATKSAGHALGEGTLYPLASAGWNTLVAPPLALAGQQPAPERADGFWMKRLQDPAEADIRAHLASWQQHWQQEPTLAERREALAAQRAAHEARVAALRRDLDAENDAWARTQHEQGEQYRAMALARALAALPALQADMAAQGYSAARLEAQRDVLVAELVAQGLDRDGAGRVVDGLLGLPPGPSAPARQADDKTDPLRQVIERSATP